MVNFRILEAASENIVRQPGRDGRRRAGRRQTLALLAMVLVCFLSFAGCGGSGNSSTPANQPTTLVFTSARALDGSSAANTNGTNNVWVVKVDGSGATPLTRLTASLANSLSPVWSPDGSKIAFDSRGALDGSDAANTTNAVNNIWVVKSDGTGATPLTRLTAFFTNSFNPVWSPDGSKIAFDSSRALDGSDAANTNGTVNIWVVNADGSGATPLTKLTVNSASSQFPVWSPDGSKIAFLSRRALDGSDAGNPNLTLNVWAMKSDGTGATPLTKLTASGVFSFLPVWSPDGGKIAFQSDRALDGSDAKNTNSTVNVWAVKADGSGAAPLTKLTALRAHSGDIVWSPDGSKIAFDSSRAFDGSDAANINSVNNIWVMAADGSAAAPLTKLTALNADSFDPVWSRDGSKIAFDSQRALDLSPAANTNNVSNIWIMGADGSGPVPLTKLTASSADSFGPGWKP